MAHVLRRLDPGPLAPRLVQGPCRGCQSTGDRTSGLDEAASVRPPHRPQALDSEAKWRLLRLAVYAGPVSSPNKPPVHVISHERQPEGTRALGTVAQGHCPRSCQQPRPCPVRRSVGTFCHRAPATCLLSSHFYVSTQPSRQLPPSGFRPRGQTAQGCARSTD